MCKKLILIVFMCAAMLLCTAVAYAGSSDVYVQLDGEQLEFDVAPCIIAGRTFVPLKAISERLGAAVIWNAEERSVTVENGVDVYKLFIDENYSVLNDVRLEDGAGFVIREGHTLVPVKTIAEITKRQVYWFAEERTVYISTDPENVPLAPTPVEKPETLSPYIYLNVGYSLVRPKDAYDPGTGIWYKVLSESDSAYTVAFNGGTKILPKSKYVKFDTIEIPRCSEKRQAILQLAFAQLGKSYCAGGNGPNSFDCSGMVNYVYTLNGITVPRPSAGFAILCNISKSQLKPGDIVYKQGHVAIYVKDNVIIHAMNSAKGVGVSYMSSEVYTGFINKLGD